MRPRLKTLNRPANKPSGTMDPGDMKVAVGRPAGTAPNDNAGRADQDPLKKKKRPQFTQKYYRKEIPHPDYTFGDPFGLKTRQEDTDALNPI